MKTIKLIYSNDRWLDEYDIFGSSIGLPSVDVPVENVGVFLKAHNDKRQVKQVDKYGLYHINYNPDFLTVDNERPLLVHNEWLDYLPAYKGSRCRVLCRVYNLTEKNEHDSFLYADSEILFVVGFGNGKYITESDDLQANFNRGLDDFSTKYWDRAVVITSRDILK